MVFTLPYLLGELTMLSFCRICPAATIQVTGPALIRGDIAVFSTSTLVRIGILIAVLVLVIMSTRAFCKVMCPIGAIMAPLNYISLWIVKGPKKKCVSCLKCDRECITEVNPSERISKEIPANREQDCVVCHQCQESCPLNVQKNRNKSKIG